MINMRKLAEQQKNQRALKIKSYIIKQSHDIKLAKSLTPITKKVSEVNESNTKLGDVLKESNSESEYNQEIVPVEIESEDEIYQTNLGALPNSYICSESMTKTSGSLMSCSVSLSIKASPSGPTVLGVRIYTLGGAKLRIRDKDYELTPEIYKAMSLASYSDKTMKDENDILRKNKIIGELGYTGVGDRKPNRKTIFTITLPKLFEEIQSKTFEEFMENCDNDLEGEGVKIILSSNISDIYNRLEILLRLKLSGHTDALTERSNFLDEIYKRGEIQNKQQHRNALDKFST